MRPLGFIDLQCINDTDTAIVPKNGKKASSTRPVRAQNAGTKYNPEYADHLE
jgi:hypothetical protein